MAGAIYEFDDGNLHTGHEYTAATADQRTAAGFAQSETVTQPGFGDVLIHPVRHPMLRLMGAAALSRLPVRISPN